MQKPPDRKTRQFTEAAQQAALATRAAKRAMPDLFGQPEVFVVRAAGQAFTWEIRRFGGVVIERSTTAYPDHAAAESAGTEALNVLRQASDLPSFARQDRQRAR